MGTLVEVFPACGGGHKGERMPKYDHNQLAGDAERKIIMESRGVERFGSEVGIFGVILSGLIIGLWKLIGLCVRVPQIGISLLAAAAATVVLWMALLR